MNALYAERDFKTEAPDLLAALILAARQLPLDVVKALLPAYVKREREELERLGTPTQDEG